jgi:DNA-binding NarL/FixJ family response regulator
MGKTNVLLVDDSSVFLRVATRFILSFSHLQLAGVASDAEEALHLAEALRPNIILLDLNMPHVSGLEVIPAIRRLLPDVKIIVLTLWDSDIYRQAALAAGADDFVPKSLMNTSLMPAIDRLGVPVESASI